MLIYMYQLYTHTSTCIYIYPHGYTCTDMCEYIHTYVCKHVYVLYCMCAYIYYTYCTGIELQGAFGTETTAPCVGGAARGRAPPRGAAPRGSSPRFALSVPGSQA